MSDEEGVWVERLRQRLQSLYFRFILHFGRSLALKHADREGTARSAERGAAFDPCADDFYRSLMTSYADISPSTEVLDVYSQCREILSRDLGIVPADANKLFRVNLD